MLKRRANGCGVGYVYIYVSIWLYMAKKKLRQPEIEIWQRVAVDKPTYELLRIQKLEQSKSMMRIVKELVFEKYKNYTK
jgi:hypothetical protein